MFENPRRGRQARNFTTNVPKILDRKSSSEKLFSENSPLVPLIFLKIWKTRPVFRRHQKFNYKPDINVGMETIP